MISGAGEGFPVGSEHLPHPRKELTVRVSPIVTGILAGLLLAGCTAPSTTPTSPVASAPETTAASTPAQTDEQSVLAACVDLMDTVGDGAVAIESAMSEFAADPPKGVAALQEFQTTFEQAAAEVSNPEVKVQADKAVAASKAMIDMLAAGVKDPTKLEGLSDLITEFQNEMNSVAEVCSG